MFDFEKLEVYSRAKTFTLHVQKFLLQGKLDSAIRNQLRRSSLSIVLNIAEGSGRKTKADKRNFFIIARDSTFESVAIFDILKEEGVINHQDFQTFYSLCEELSKMLYSMIQRLEQ